jgi:hypothetical protein
MTLSTKQIYGMMIAKVHSAYRGATSKRAAWLLGFRGISTVSSQNIKARIAVYLCNNFTAKVKAIFQVSNSFKNIAVSKNMTNAKNQLILVLFIFIFLIVGISDSSADEQFIRLAWSPNTELHLSHYKLYRDTKSGTMVYLTTINRSDTIYTDAEIIEGNNYYYKLTAVDDQGFESAPSNEVIAITKSIPEPGETNGDHSVIEQFDLKQNYPNPFNPTTTIDYQVAQYTNVSITIFNVLGKEVRNLVNEYKEAGNYQVVWDGRDNDGQRVASGLYFYQMTTIKYRAVKKLMVQK